MARSAFERAVGFHVRCGRRRAKTPRSRCRQCSPPMLRRQRPPSTSDLPVSGTHLHHSSLATCVVYTLNPTQPKERARWFEWQLINHMYECVWDGLTIHSRVEVSGEECEVLEQRSAELVAQLVLVTPGNPNESGMTAPQTTILQCFCHRRVSPPMGRIILTRRMYTRLVRGFTLNEYSVVSPISS